MITEQTLRNILLHTSLDDSEIDSVVQEISYNMLFVGKELYVITQQVRNSAFEVAICCVTKISYNSKKDKITFYLRGRYRNGNHYNSNFTLSSLGRKVFLSEADANTACELKNSKRGN